MTVSACAGYLSCQSLILCNYIKRFHYRERSARFIACMPDELIKQIVSNLLHLLDPVG